MKLVINNFAVITLAGFDPNDGGTPTPYTESNFEVGDFDGHPFITDPIVTQQQPGNAAASVGNGEILEIDTPDSANVTFTGSGGELVLDQPATFTGAIKDFGAQNAIDVLPVDFTSSGFALGYAENARGTGGILTISDGTHTASIALLGSYAAASFVTGAEVTAAR